MYCPNCGESNKDAAKFCNNCGASLAGVVPSKADVAPGPSPSNAAPAVSAPPATRPIAAFGLALVSVFGMLAVSLTMSFVDDAPGEVGSPIEGLFHTAGTVQLLLGLGVLVSAMFIVVKGFDVELWGTAIMGLGVISVLTELVVVAEGTFAVVFLAIPGALAALAGFFARRSALRARTVG